MDTTWLDVLDKVMLLIGGGCVLVWVLVIYSAPNLNSKQAFRAANTMFSALVLGMVPLIYWLIR